MSGAKDSKSCRSRKILQKEPTLAIITAHTDEKAPLKIWGDLFSDSVGSLVAPRDGEHVARGGQ